MLLVLCGMCAVKACPGVCVAERIADYCEAVLDVSELCKSGLRCCVSRDSYGDGELPPNLVLMDRNVSHSTSGEILFRIFFSFLEATGIPSPAPRCHSCVCTTNSRHDLLMKVTRLWARQLQNRCWISIEEQLYFSAPQLSGWL